MKCGFVVCINTNIMSTEFRFSYSVFRKSGLCRWAVEELG
jgi:hypothetical protein